MNLEILSQTDEIILKLDDEGILIGTDGEKYKDTPLMRELIKTAIEIKKNLPPVPNDHMRLWRGNRNGEVGLNPSYTNSLEGIALPFSRIYKGPISYIDIPEQDLGKYLVSGAINSEFILPTDLVKSVSIVGMSSQEAEELKSQSNPVDLDKSDSWEKITV